MYDLVIRGGTIVDGAGGPGVVGDVGVADGRIVVVGQLEPDLVGPDTVEVDASDLVVAPGFVDVHTHYDAQVFWDSTLSPSPLHGVTTVIGGNCGFTIAPLSDDPADGEYLRRMLARVEGMPLEALEEGVPWNWRTFGEYLAAFEGTLSINAGFKVGHSAIRRVVMGSDATAGPASPDQLTAMKDLLRESLAAGALGFSSTWSRTHNDAEGDPVPSRHATAEELTALCGVVSEFPGTSLEFLPAVGQFDDETFDLMADMSVAAQRPLNWNLLNVTASSLDRAMHQLEGGTRAQAKGGKVVALTVPMPIGLRLSFLTGFVFDSFPGWEEAMHLPPEEKLALLADPAERDRLNELAQGEHALRNLARWDNMVVTEAFSDTTKPFEGRTIGDLAAEENKAPFDLICEIAIEDGLRTAFSPAAKEETDADWEARAQVWRDGRAVIGASDAGAHLDLLGTFNYSTELLAHAVRERSVVSLEEAIHLITDVPAKLYGLVDRGRIEVGAHADLVVLNPETVGPRPAYTRVDLPAGASRIYGEADGIDRVIVSGQVVVSNGEFTDARPGALIRSGVDTTTPTLT